MLNLRGIKTSAQMNEALCAGMVVVVLLFLACVVRTVWGIHHDPGFFTHPFYDPANFHPSSIFAGTSVAVLTYIGFDAISTFSEEVRNPRRNILLATVLVCLITGLLSGLEVYAAQLIWGSKPFASENVESAFALVSGKAGGMVLFQIVNFTLLIANMGSGMGSQLAAGRLLYGMGRGNALPKSFFGAIEPKHRVPRNNILAVGAFALAGAGLLEFFANRLGGGAYEIGAQCLNFGAFIAFMGVNAAAFVHHWRQTSSTQPWRLHCSRPGLSHLRLHLVQPQQQGAGAGYSVDGCRHHLRSDSHPRLPRRAGHLRGSFGRSATGQYQDRVIL